MSPRDKAYKRARNIAGGGGSMGKGGGDQTGGTPEEDADTLISRSYARVIDALSEGPIQEWYHPEWPLLDIFFDNTPAQNSDPWAVYTNGKTVASSKVFEQLSGGRDFPVFKKSDGTIVPTKSPIVGRYLVGRAADNVTWDSSIIPYWSWVVSVESTRKLTLAKAALSATSSLRWQLGGSLNFKNFSWENRNGTQGQPFMGSIPLVEAEHPDPFRIKKSGPPYSHVFTDTTLDACRITIRLPQLERQNVTTGDVHGWEVRLKFFVNGSLVKDDNIQGKCSHDYLRSYQFDFANWPGVARTVTVERVSNDSTSQAMRDETWIWSYAELTFAKLAYPNTALIGLRIDASQFQQIPTRSYRIKGLKIKIPNNYDPVTRLYTGVWNGTFATAWTDNPAWCWYDMCTNGRYGLGHMLIEANIDKWTLYTIAQYCDAVNARPANAQNNYGPTGKHGVPNGQTPLGYEPRFTCNLYLQRAEDSVKVLQDMAGIFRGMLAYINGSITPLQDAPTDPSSYRMFSPANVVNGSFSYSGVGLRARHNVAIVSWSDLKDSGRMKQEYVEDHGAIAKVGGINRLEITGFGCTSRSQARRIGLWAIYAEKILTDTISFATALEGYFIKPGQLIQIQDPFRAGKVLSGRLGTTPSTASLLNLDRPIVLDIGSTYTVALIDPATNHLVSKAVTTASDGLGHTTIACAAFAFTPEPQGIFQLAANVLVPQLFRVLNTTMKGDNIVEISGLEYNASLYDFVDFNHPLVEPITSLLPGATRTLPPANLFLAVIQIIKPDNTIQQDIEVAWDNIRGGLNQPDPFLARYRPSYRYNQGNWEGRGGQFDTDVTTFRLTNVRPGDWEFQIYAVNTLGIKSDPIGGDITVHSPPTNVTGVTGLELFGQANNTQFQTRDAHFVWRVTGDTSPEGGPQQTPSFEEKSAEIGSPNPMMLAFGVEIYNDADLLWSDRTLASEYTFTWDQNSAAAQARYGAGTPPFRRFRMEVRVLYADNTRSDPARITVENPAPLPPTGITKTTISGGGVAFQWTNPLGIPDLDHMELFYALDPNTNVRNLATRFTGTFGQFYPPDLQPYYYWLCSVDTFGTRSLLVPIGFSTGQVVADPTFDPAPGSYPDSSITVTIGEETPDCDILYNLVAIGQPASGNWIEGSSVFINSSSTLYALARSRRNPADTAMAHGDYYINQAGTVSQPTFNPDPGFFTVEKGDIVVTIATTTSGANIRYTTDGVTVPTNLVGTLIPSTSGTYTLPLGDTTLQAVAFKAGSTNSSVLSGDYTVSQGGGGGSGTCSTPTYSPAAGSFQANQFPLNVAVTCSNPTGASISYTTDGTIPTETHGTVIASGANASVAAGKTLKSVAFKNGYITSGMASGLYSTAGALPSPTFNPAPAVYPSYPKNITITSSTSGSSIRYTTNGTTPTDTVGTLISGTSGTASVSVGQTLKAVAFKAGFTTSGVTSGVYSGKVNTPVHNPDSRSYFIPPGLTVTISCTPPSGVAISGKYTTNGSTPSRTNGTLISFPFDYVIGGGAYHHIKSIAYTTTPNVGFLDSDVQDSEYDKDIIGGGG
jgi:predicted phage tail protein